MIKSLASNHKYFHLYLKCNLFLQGTVPQPIFSGKFLRSRLKQFKLCVFKDRGRLFQLATTKKRQIALRFWNFSSSFQEGFFEFTNAPNETDFEREFLCL